MKQFLLSACLLFAILIDSKAQTKLWHDIKRQVHYQPEGNDFVLVNGNKRFNRALYGGNSAFRVEVGDLPEMALYLPGMGGNLKFGLIKNNKSKWLIEADSIYTRYRPGSMLYTIGDALLGKGSLHLTVLATYDNEGLLVKLEAEGIPKDVQLVAVYGGATGSKFSRDGDIGADPESSFYLKPEYCTDNIFKLNKNSFQLYFGSKKPLSEEERYEIQHKPLHNIDSANKAASLKLITGIFPPEAVLKLADAHDQGNPGQLLSSTTADAPVLVGKMPLKSTAFFFIQNKQASPQLSYVNLKTLFQQTESRRQALANRIQLNTPDAYINTLGGALSIAADAVWEDPSFLHGAVAWRMRLNGWRGAYLADVLGWHDRGRKHFESYSRSQLTSPKSAPVVMDTALHLARGLEKLGTSLFSSGYISRNPDGDFRAHHYDMNLVFIDQLLNHFLWTGDTAFMRQMWPLLQRHLDWEKRNFDADGDGLYDSYAAIWASDALQYAGGGVTHSSAYNYRSNLMAAEIAKTLGANPMPYQQEAEKILKAINEKLWMKDRGWYAEYKDLLGNGLLHKEPGLWTIYHALDAKIADPFQAWQSLNYIDKHIPHIPIKAEGLADTNLYTLSTTNWQPYTWSLNNVALAELLHTTLAYWQAGRSEEAFRLWKSSLMESMYLGASPGNIQQLSFYDAIRGELYRDFADPIGMTARSLVEGLFGIQPDALHHQLIIQPRFPIAWNHASITTPDIKFSYRRNGNEDTYHIKPDLFANAQLVLLLPAMRARVESVVVNGKTTDWDVIDSSVEKPTIRIKIAPAKQYQVSIRWKGESIEQAKLENEAVSGEPFIIRLDKAIILDVYDPQGVLAKVTKERRKFKAIFDQPGKAKSFFIKLQQEAFTYWMPVTVDVLSPIDIIETRNGYAIKNNSSQNQSARLVVNFSYEHAIGLPAKATQTITIPSEFLVVGSNSFTITANGQTMSKTIINWSRKSDSKTRFHKINLDSYFNDDITNIFKQQYLSPRPKVSTLQLPTQGIGNWAYPLTTANINDSGWRKRAGTADQIVLEQGIPFATPSTQPKNIAFTSKWDNYPDSILIPLNEKAQHAYLLMAGSTNAMQSRMTNGVIIVYYKDGSAEKLELKNPENWWPIEQDYYEDGFAFTTNAPKPIRVYLKSGIDSREYNDFTTIKGFSNRAIDGGAATVLDLPLNPNKELKSLVVKTIANDVVIGLMSLTLLQP